MSKTKVCEILLVVLFLITSIFVIQAPEVGAKDKWWVHPPKNGKHYVIGYSPRSRLSPVWAITLGQARKTAKELGIELRVLDIESETDSAGQLRVLEDFITQDVDFIITCPVADETVVMPITKAAKAKIMLGLMFSKAQVPGIPNGFDLDVDAEEASIMMANYAALYLNFKADFVVITGVAGNPYTRMRIDGMNHVFKTYKDINVLAKQPADWERLKGQQVMEDFLVRFGDKITAIYAHNEEMGIGAGRAYQAAGKRVPPIFCFNGHLEGITDVKEGLLTATVDFNWAAMGEGMLKQAVGILKGEKPRGEHLVMPNNLVTPANADYFISYIKNLGIL